MNKKIKNIAIFFAILFSFFLNTSSASAQERIVADSGVCTMDAQMCPNGKFVGRTGPNCEFVCDGKVQIPEVSDNAAERRADLISKLKAQIEELKNRIQEILNQRAPANVKANFSYKMKIGSTDRTTNGEVTKLQKLLISENVYPEKIVSGYYGKLTSKAVRNLMNKYNIKVEPEYRIGSFTPRVHAEFLKKKNVVVIKPCTKENIPVCGEVQENTIRCIQAPCPSNQVKKTFSNKCIMENASAKFLYKGKCEDKKVSVDYTGKLKMFSNEKELKEFIAKNKTQDTGYIDMPFMDGGMGKESFIPVPAMAEPVMMKGESVNLVSISSTDSDDFSGTNIQVSGVDEADIVKNDGRYIYTLSDSKKISIIDTKNPEDLKLVAEITADKNENIREMYLYDNKLVLISNLWNYQEEPFFHEPTTAKIGTASTNNSSAVNAKMAPSMYYGGKDITRVEVYDISNTGNPVKRKTIEFEGNINNSRVTNGHLYLLTNKYFNLYNNGPIMPIVAVDGKNISNMFGTSFYYFDEPIVNRNILSINAVDLDNLTDISSKRILMPYVGQIHVSQKNIYLTHQKYVNQNEIMVDIQNKVFADLIDISDNDRELIEKINSTDMEILPNWEKARKIANIYRKYEISLNKDEVKKIKEKVASRVYDEYKKLRKEFQKTMIEKFSLNGTKVSPVASGEVSGGILNQFSMNEKDGYFHIATTNNNIWLPWQLRDFVENNERFETENNLYILDKNLNPAGSVEGVAKGERIQSARFVNDNAYMVTFKQVDPLFNIDISNPYNPKILGELKIPGFSQYLHPVFKDRLIGLGRDVRVDKNGNVRNAGIKVTLFDISSKEPKEIESLYFGKEGSYSEALNNHKAVLISDEKGIMAFPVTLYKEKGYDYNSRENVVVLLKITRDGISEIAQIHNDNDWGAKTKRTLYINDMLYSVAPWKILSNKISDGDAIGKIILKDYVNEGGEIYPEPIILNEAL